MQDSDYFTLSIAGVSLIISIVSIIVSSKYSKISLIHSLHELALQKAKDCNTLYGIAQYTESQTINELTTQIKMIDTISEITISVQLIDQSARAYYLKGRRTFFLLQFWTQLNTSLRFFLKQGSFHHLPTATQNQLSIIVKTFATFFKHY